MTIKDIKSPSVTSNGKLVQSERHESAHTRSPRALGSQVQSPLEVPFSVILFFSPYVSNIYKNKKVFQ